ncbi:MAG: hypothetical protein PHV12_05680 [Bacteroidales bacterium]|nr:hypothetical protein [Bacteroidales bacterium]
MRLHTGKLGNTALVAIALCLSVSIIAQEGYTFAKDRKGSVKSRSDISYTFREMFPVESPEFLKESLNKIASILLSSETVTGANGVDIEAYSSVSEFSNVDLSFQNLARSEGDAPGEYYHKGSSSVNVYINDPQSASGNNLYSGFFELPVKVGEFQGYPVYDCTVYKYVLVAPGVNNPFLPYSKEDLIRRMIKEEQEKIKMFESAENDGSNEKESIDKGLKDIKREYAEMKKMAEAKKKSDPEQAAILMESVKGMELVIKELENSASRDFANEAKDNPEYTHHKEVVRSLEEELNGMSPAERAKQAVWSDGTPLYKLNPALKRSSERINFMTVMFLTSNPGMDRTPADGCVERIKGESQIWRQIFSLAEGN